MNNIAAGAVLLPAIIGITRQTDVKPSKLLMPLSFATMLGGMATLLTTSNILVSNALRDANLKGFSLFDFAPVGVPLIIVGITYMTFIGRKLLPERSPGGRMRAIANPKELADLYGMKQGICQIYVTPESSMAGVSLADGGWSDKLGHRNRVSRGGSEYYRLKEISIIEGDVVLAGGYTDDVELAIMVCSIPMTPRSGELASDEPQIWWK